MATLRIQMMKRGPGIKRHGAFVVLLIVMAIFATALFAIEPGGPTLAEQAERALTAGDTPLAVELYARWLEAVPGDHVAWYNYACALALDGKKTEALRALDDAVTAGWRDAEWTMKDPDLETVRGEPEFEIVIERINGLQTLDAAPLSSGALPYYASVTAIAPYRVRLPVDYEPGGAGLPVVVLLHGRGGDMNSLVDLPDRLALQGVIYVMPRALYAVDQGQAGFEYWPRDLQSSGRDSLLELARESSMLWVRAAVRGVSSRFPADTNRVIIIGYSQGGAMTYLSLLHDPGFYLGGAVLEGYIPGDRVDDYDFAPLAKSGTALFIGHGTEDRVVNVDRARLVLGKVEDAGVNVTAKFFPSDHAIPDEMVVDLADWIRDLIVEKGE